MSEKKVKTSTAFSSEARRLLKALSERLGVSKSAILELVIREKAKSEGIK